MKPQIHIMGIVNLNDDSFYAASRTPAGQALSKIAALQAEGAGVIDLGACSTRPGSSQPSLEEEWRRLEPVLKAIATLDGNGVTLSEAFARTGSRSDASERVTPFPTTTLDNPAQANAPENVFPSPFTPLRFSVDTYRAEIVRRTYETIGPFMVNDISAGALDPEMLPLVGRLGLPYVAMHMRGTPETMSTLTDYPTDITSAVLAYFEEFAAKAEQNGIRDWILDPGYGFAKTLDQNYELLRSQRRLLALGRPILAGVSRKSMIYKLLGITPEEALPATQVIHLAALQQGATWLRVHDVAEAVRTARLFERL